VPIVRGFGLFDTARKGLSGLAARARYCMSHESGKVSERLEALTDALLSRPVPLLRTFTNNLMAYALGRLVDHRDQPAVREIVAGASRSDYRMSAFVTGVVLSDAFRMQRAGPTTDAAGH